MNLIRESTGQEQGVNPGSPLVVITKEKDRRLLQFAEMNPGAAWVSIVILKQDRPARTSWYFVWKKIVSCGVSCTFTWK